jgi:uncharacterized protein (TIGR02588 family)
MSDKKQKDPTEHTKITRDPGRSAAEWVSLGISIAILILLAGLVLYAYLSDREAPAVIEVQPQLEQVRNESGSYYLPIEVKNIGNQTAQEVSVQISLLVENVQAESITVTFPFLGGGESARAVVVFPQDPALGELDVVISFLEP